MKKILAIILLITLLLVGCKIEQRSGNENTNPAEPGYITVSSTLVSAAVKSGGHLQGGETATAGQALTAMIRAQVIGVRGDDNSNRFETVIYKDGKGIELDQLAEFQVDASTGLGSDFKKVRYPELDPSAPDKNVDSLGALINLKAFAPPTSVDSETDVVRTENKVIFKNLDGKVDVMTTQLQGNNGTYKEPASGQGSGAVGKGNVALTFHHMLSKVSFKIKAGTTGNLTEIIAAWGKIKSIELLGYPNSLELDLNTNKVKVPDPTLIGTIFVHQHGTGGNVGAGWELTSVAVDLETTGAGCLHRGAMVPPGETMTIRIISEHEPEGVEVTFERKFVAAQAEPVVTEIPALLHINKHHSYTLSLSTLKGVEMTSTTLVDWDPVEGSMDF